MCIVRSPSMISSQMRVRVVHHTPTQALRVP
jgi:hypothetical protein